MAGPDARVSQEITARIFIEANVLAACFPSMSPCSVDKSDRLRSPLKLIKGPTERGVLSDIYGLHKGKHYCSVSRSHGDREGILTVENKDCQDCKIPDVNDPWFQFLSVRPSYMAALTLPASMILSSNDPGCIVDGLT